jgi:hypothetical protein
VKYTKNLEGSTSLKAQLPDDNRLVIVQAIEHGRVKTLAARHLWGRWIGEETGYDLTDAINASEQAIWFESPLFPATAMGIFPNA